MISLLKRTFNDDQREDADLEFADELDIPCPDHGDCVFTTACGVTRCVVCRKVVA